MEKVLVFNNLFFVLIKIVVKCFSGISCLGEAILDAKVFSLMIFPSNYSLL